MNDKEGMKAYLSRRELQMSLLKTKMLILETDMKDLEIKIDKAKKTINKKAKD